MGIKYLNLTDYKFDKIGIRIEGETQSIHCRIFDFGTDIQIGTCVIEAVGIGQGIVKNLFIDSQFRSKKKISEASQALRLVGVKIGFIERMHQRKKDGKFLTFIKSLEHELEQYEKIAE